MREADAREERFRGFFPYKPYPAQLEYARDVARLVEEGGVGFLEAPTGFGKTVSILSAVLPYPYRVFYYSRTHTQMRQVAYELERINSLGYGFTGVVRGSRLQLCLDRDVREMDDYLRADEVCLSRIRSEEDGRSLAELSLYRSDVSLASQDRLPSDVRLYCEFEGRRVEIPGYMPHGVPTVASVERLLEYGDERDVCPYYLAKVLSQVYRVVIGAYNYLFLDPGFKGQVIVMDEAHNVEDFCKESKSYALSRRTVERAIDEVKEVDRPWASDVEEFLAFLSRFFSHADFKEDELLTRRMILKEMEECGVTRERIEEFLEGWPLIINIQRELIARRGRVVILDRLRVAQVYAFIETFMSSGEEEYVGFWNAEDEKNPVLEWLCLDPRVAFSEILSEKPRAVILTSGTLSPVEGMAARLGVPEAFKRSYPSVIPKDNIMILAVGRGPSGKPLTTKYEMRGDEETVLEYGEAVARIVRNVPNGTIVFFPAYQVMNRMLNTWNTYGVLGEIDAAVFIESPGSTASLVDAYRKAAREDKAVLFAVVRGKLSEGANFPDESGRAVVIVGIPYPNISDPRVMAQREYYDRVEESMGRRWYLDQSFNAVNQSLGRVWRHKEDYAVGVLLDTRYAWRESRRRLSPWLAERTTHVDPRTPFQTVERMIRAFFKG
ncbi:MAG: helicase C-terminal domain-containing protein [Candidatus Freyarchaeota archaeon]|nr:helicase C-terminal domain-containing protein [Candidatus Freyrarchaeum guaymaensis]